MTKEQHCASGPTQVPLYGHLSLIVIVNPWYRCRANMEIDPERIRDTFRVTGSGRWCFFVFTDSTVMRLLLPRLKTQLVKLVFKPKGGKSRFAQVIDHKSQPSGYWANQKTQKTGMLLTFQQSCDLRARRWQLLNTNYKLGSVFSYSVTYMAKYSYNKGG